MVSSVTILLRWALLPMSLVVGLAAVLRMAAPVTGGHADISGVIRLPRPVTGAIFGLFGLAVLVFALGLVRRVRGRRRGPGEAELAEERPPVPAWLRTLTQILSLVNFVVLAYLIWRGVVPLTDLLNLGQAASGLGGRLPEAPEGAPAFVNWTFGVLAAITALGALALAVWLGFSDRLTAWWTRRDEEAWQSPAAAAAVGPLADPRDEDDPRRAIMRCYARFERVAADSGVARQPWHTPMEFMREALRRLETPRGAVPTLTSLFELARFSHRPLGAAERGRAIDALDDITGTTEDGRAHAARR
jgi:hypothetical protein